ncbi:GNAT family N-acetyltransferase [Chitinophaga sp. MD30]|nr:GNAT family N-acetyltransferase [Chitinophaga sp. MD30]
MMVYPCNLPLLVMFLQQNEAAFRMLDVHAPEDWPREDLVEALPYFISQLQQQPDAYPWFCWVIVDKDIRTIAGDIGFKGVPNKAGAVEIGYSILPAYRNKGYATEAVEGMLSWAFMHQSVRRVLAECDVTNIASVNVLQKAGMHLIANNGEMLYWQKMK